MKVYVQVIDTRTGIYQYGMIEEPVSKDLEVNNALGHFGIRYGDVDWDYSGDPISTGKVRGTTKVVSVVCLNVP